MKSRTMETMVPSPACGCVVRVDCFLRFLLDSHDELTTGEVTSKLAGGSDVSVIRPVRHKRKHMHHHRNSIWIRLQQ